MHPSRGQTVLSIITLLLPLGLVFNPHFDPAANTWVMVSFLAGVGTAILLLVIQRHPMRRLGLVPFGWSLLLIALAVDPYHLAGMIGVGVALVVLPLDPAMWPVVRVRLGTRGILAIILVILFLTKPILNLPEETRRWFRIAYAAIGTIAAWIVLFRSVVELGLEVLFWPMYRIRAHGPGARLIPRKGPVLIVCNHSAYADPFWVGKVVPRFLRPLMGSVFYDLPIISFMMRNLIRAIRVPVTPFRRTAPELDEAVAGLKRGDCIVLFPEGRLRRKAEVLLGSFGQGAWRILKEVPQTQVVCVWIEGGWGSFSSYAGGKPMQGKSLDWRRPIDVALAAPVVLPPEILASQEAARAELRRAVLDCRRILGLDPVVDEQIAEAGSGQEEEVHEINP